MLPKKSKKENKPGIFSSALLILAAVAVVLFLAVTNWRIMQRRGELDNKLESLEAQLFSLQEKNLQLEDNMAESQSPEYLERIARENLDLKKPGEEVVVVKPPTTTTEEKIPEKNFWQKLLEKIGL